MTGPAASSAKPPPRPQRLWAAGAATLLAALVWGVWTLYFTIVCSVGGFRGAGGLSAWLAFAPAMVLCVFGFLLLRRSPAAVFIAPVPLILWLFVIIAAAAAPSVFEFPACALNAPLLRSRWAAVPLLFTVVVPYLGVLALHRTAPESFLLSQKRAAAIWAVASRPRNVCWALAMALTAGVAAFATAILRPIPIDADWPMSFRQDPSNTSSWDVPSRLSMLRVRWSILEGAQERFLGRVLERRLGPLRWSSRSVAPWGRVVTAVGHFPRPLYQRAYQKRIEQSQRCVADTSGIAASEKFIGMWSGHVRGNLTPAEIAWAASIFRRADFAIPRRYERQPNEWCWQVRSHQDWTRLLPAWQRDTADLLSPAEWDRLAALMLRNHSSVLAMTCFDLWSSTHLSQTPEGEIDCPPLDPGSEEEFSRIAIEWWCIGIRCRWNWHDPTPWQRVSGAPCRTGGKPLCWHEWQAYLLTGQPIINEINEGQ